VASRRPGTSPITRQPGGSLQQDRCVRRLALPPGCRVIALEGGRWDAAPHLPTQPQQFLRLAISEACPPGEGMVLSGRAAFADVAPLRGHWPRPSRSGWPATCGKEV
jgi:hypothetical protein